MSSDVRGESAGSVSCSDTSWRSASRTPAEEGVRTPQEDKSEQPGYPTGDVGTSGTRQRPGRRVTAS